MTYSTTRALSRLAGRTVITVGGVDVTTVYGLHTPEPSYSLSEPFAYGATTLVFPQIHAGYAAIGTGELSWAKAGKRVVISRVFADLSETIDYVGEVASIGADGRALSLDVGGEFSGPASMLDEQTQMYRQNVDIGRWAALVVGRVGLSLLPWAGPVTGIKVTHAGGQTVLSWAQYLGAMSQDSAGVQRALMPIAWGSQTYGFSEKDYTTRHLTVFNDDARVVLSVSKDVSEAPNVIYGTGITPNGERVTNAKWPGVFAGPAPDYPMAASAPFGSGTTDADTINGDGITVLFTKLVQMGFEAADAVVVDHTYDSAMVAAVKRFQKAASLSATGTMTTTGWARLFDTDYTGCSVGGGFIAPLAFDPRVMEFLYTSNGSTAGRNPVYDSTIPRVERTRDYGSGMTRVAMIASAQGELARAAAYKNWVGTIRLNLTGAFTGDHSDATGLTDADLMPYRDIRPGMNVWVPYFDGGTLFHIAGVDVDPSGATLTVDTQARDLVEVSAIIARDAESRRDIRREWMAANRNRQPSTGMVACDEGFGWLDRNVHLDGNQWNIIPVIAGQSGQVNKVDIRLVNDAAEFAVAAFSQNMTRKRLRRKVGNPLTTGGESVWETSDIQDWFDNDVILYATGDGKQPCGYGKRRKRDDNGNLTGAPLTGRLLDRASWPYIAAAHTAVIVYVAIYPDRDCTLKKGRILYPQLDDAA